MTKLSYDQNEFLSENTEMFISFVLENHTENEGDEQILDVFFLDEDKKEEIIEKFFERFEEQFREFLYIREREKVFDEAFDMYYDAYHNNKIFL